MKFIGSVLFFTICPVLQAVFMLGADKLGQETFTAGQYIACAFIPFYAWYAILTG